MVSIKELERQLAIERKKWKKVKKKKEKKLEKKRLKQELFTLKHRRAIKVARVIARGTGKVAKGTMVAARRLEEVQREKAKKTIRKKAPKRKVRRETGGIMDLVENL